MKIYQSRTNLLGKFFIIMSCLPFVEKVNFSVKYTPENRFFPQKFISELLTSKIYLLVCYFFVYCNLNIICIIVQLLSSLRPYNTTPLTSFRQASVAS